MTCKVNAHTRLSLRSLVNALGDGLGVVPFNQLSISSVYCPLAEYITQFWVIKGKMTCGNVCFSFLSFLRPKLPVVIASYHTFSLEAF